jgi:hypothetical protein
MSQCPNVSWAQRTAGAAPLPEIEAQPHEPELPPLDTAPQIDPDGQHWAEELPLLDEQRRDQALARETHGGSLESYQGSAASALLLATGRTRPISARRGREVLAVLCLSSLRRRSGLAHEGVAER